MKAFLLALLLTTAASAQKCLPLDAVFYNGNILTGRNLLTDHPERVSALAIAHGEIIYAGTDEQALGICDYIVQKVDLHGAFVMPGFNDAHTHIAYAGAQRLTLDLDNVPSLADMQSRIASYAKTLPPGDWIRGSGWDHTKWPSKTLPTLHDIDAVTGNHPTLLLRTDLHIAIVNTAALTAAHITDTTPNPHGGQIDRDSNGHATGIIREQPALTLIENIIPPPSIETRRKALLLSIDDALAHGVTSLQDFSDWDDWLVLEELEHTHKLPIRIAEWIDFNLPLGDLDTRRASHDPNDPLLHLTFLKGFMDGSLGSRTAAMNEPYSDDPANSGIPRYDQDKLNKLASDRAADGFQLGFHAIGDRANDMALDAFAAAEQVAYPEWCPRMPTNPGAIIVTADIACVDQQSKIPDFRFRIEHAQVLSPDAFDRFHSLGIIASMQPSHLLTDMAWAPARLGPERSKYAYAWRSMLDHHITLAFGTDYPVESINPFRGLYAAITRQNIEATQTFHPEQKISLNEAIYAYTQASAFAEFRETTKGILAPNYLADFIVLDRDITKSTPQELLHTQVLRTVVNGQTQYEAPHSH